MRNPFSLLKALLPDPPLQVGTVIGADSYSAIVQLPDGGTTSVRGATTVGARVFFRDGVIEGAAPVLPIEVIEV